MTQPKLQISCSIIPTNPSMPLGFKVMLDDELIFVTTHVTSPIDFEYDLPDTEGEHCLEFIMRNKTAEHTQIDEQGNIVSDSCLHIANLAFDEIELKQIFVDQAVYTHDFNGTQPETQEKFYGEMGCNGTVSLKFSTPMYLWLLENM